MQWCCRRGLRLRQTERVSADDVWAPLAERFVDGHYGTLRGRVRTHVIACHLREHLPRPPAALVDVGGGAGNQSIPLARDGYQVAIVDPSAAMLAKELRGMILGQTLLAIPVVIALGATAIRRLPAGLLDQAHAYGARGVGLATFAMREARVGIDRTDPAC